MIVWIGDTNCHQRSGKVTWSVSLSYSIEHWTRTGELEKPSFIFTNGLVESYLSEGHGLHLHLFCFCQNASDVCPGTTFNFSHNKDG